LGKRGPKPGHGGRPIIHHDDYHKEKRARMKNFRKRQKQASPQAILYSKLVKAAEGSREWKTWDVKQQAEVREQLKMISEDVTQHFEKLKAEMERLYLETELELRTVFQAKLNELIKERIELAKLIRPRKISKVMHFSEEPIVAEAKK